MNLLRFVGMFPFNFEDAEAVPVGVVPPQPVHVVPPQLVHVVPDQPVVVVPDQPVDVDESQAPVRRSERTRRQNSLFRDYGKFVIGVMINLLSFCRSSWEPK